MINEETVTTTPADLQEVRHQVEDMLAEGRGSEAMTVLFTIIEAMLRENSGLAVRVAALLKQIYGRRSEKVDPNQLRLFLDALTENPSAQEIVAELPPSSDEPLPKPQPKAAPHGRKPLPANLPRVTVDLEPSEAEKHCDTCDCDKVVIGHETSELLDFEPARFVVKVLRRVKMACPACETGVVVAPVADKVIEKGRPGAGLLAHLLVGKYQDSLPLTRQVEIFKRHGVDLSTSTLSDWVGAGADAFRSIYWELVKQAMQAHVLGTDDTGLRVLDKDHENGIRKGYMWAYVGDQRIVVFDYTPTRKSEGPASFLVKRKGIVQCDAYSGYKRIAREQPDVVWAGCLAHARRKFIEALDAGDVRAAIAIALIRSLYEVEAEATAAGLDHEQRLEERRAVGKVHMANLGNWLNDMRLKEPPKTPLGRAITYAINQWASFQVYLTDGRVPIDNNSVERQIRRIAVGRKNYLFAGSDEGARRAAILYSILGTCSLVGADPFAYMRDVLERISGDWRYSRVSELTPAAWVEEKARAAAPQQDQGQAPNPAPVQATA
jgi:transposase